jgi:hypothetical protein
LTKRICDKPAELEKEVNRMKRKIRICKLKTTASYISEKLLDQTATQNLPGDLRRADQLERALLQELRASKQLLAGSA